MSKLKREETDPMIMDWISKVVEPLDPNQDLLAQLKDGIILCKLINKLKPGAIPKINTGKLPFHKMENIAKYLEACKSLGLGADKIFTTPALYEEKDPTIVRLNLYSLGMLAKTLKGWTGPNMEPIKPPEQINIQESERLKGRHISDQSTESKPQVTGNATADTIDLATKEALKFNPELEQCAREWVEAVLGEKLKNPSFIDALKDGIILSRVLNRIKPDTIKRINTTNLSKFRSLENIVYYIQGCVSLGLPQDHIFDPADLFDEKNLNLVLTNLQTLGTVFVSKLAKDLPVMRTPSSTPSFYSSLITSDELTPEEEQKAKELAQWLNTRGIEITNLGTDLTDGVKFIKLLESLTKQSIGTYHTDPYLPWHKMQNNVLILRFVGEQAAYAVRDCTKTDLMLGKLKPLISLLSYVRQKFDTDFKFKEFAVNERSKKIVEEIRETEETYVTMLEKVESSIIAPLKEALAKKKPILTEEELYNVFCNLSDILKLHQTILGELNAKVANYSGATTTISEIFLKNKDKILKLYIEYVKNFETVYSHLKYFKKKRSNFKPIIKEFELEQKKTNALDVPSFLILPVQRIPRYMLLLTELEKYTAAEHPDKKHLTKAIEEIKDVLQILDDSKANSNQRIVVIEKVLDNMDFQLQLVHPEREFIREGRLRVCEEEDEHPYVFLFNDMLIYTEHRVHAQEHQKPYEVKQIIPFGFCESVEADESDPTSFYLKMEDDKMKCTCIDASERANWINDIAQQIEKKLIIDFN